jgi:maleamate amidohydrolase
VPRVIKLDLARQKPAVLVLDMQELFTSPDGPFSNTGAEETIRALNPFVAACRELGLPVIFSNYTVRADGLDAGLLRGMPWVEQGYMSEGSSSVDIDRRLVRGDTDVVLTHNRPSAFFRTNLDGVLGSLGMDSVLLCGLSVNNAVSATARDAFARDIPALVVRDCTGAAPWEADLDTYFGILEAWTAEVDSSAAVLERLRARSGTG